jgi:hypothetical protein
MVFQNRYASIKKRLSSRLGVMTTGHALMITPLTLDHQSRLPDLNCLSGPFEFVIYSRAGVPSVRFIRGSFDI